MTASPAEIKNTAARIQRQAPNLNMGMYVPYGLRANLEELAADAGMPLSARGKCNDNDLISVYLVALKDGNAAISVARKITLRHEDIFSMPPIEAPAPTPRQIGRKPTPREEFDPLAPMPTPTPKADMDAIRTLIKQEVKEGALDPLQAAIERTTDRFFTELARIPGEAAETALEALKPTMAGIAHTAVVDALKAMTPARLDVSMHGEPPIALGLVHAKQAMLITMLSAGVNVYLHGPAGSGKTTAGQKAADAFKLQFYFAAKVESEYQLMGFKDAKGETVRTPFREAYELGGVFLFDEMDASSPSAVVALNAALTNGICPFPDKIVPRHKDFICIGAGNTQLTGASRAYAGRNQLDAASINRFAFLEWGYDEHLEGALATDASWFKYVTRVRKVVADRKLNHLVSPRATYDGCKLLAKGLDWDAVADMVVFKGLDRDTVKQIQEAL